MDRENIKELYYITLIKNVPSIILKGILSHNKAEKIDHKSIAMSDVQEIRKMKKIPMKGSLHNYVNLYFDAHNPMLSRRREYNDKICVICINPNILDLEGVVVTDRNAAAYLAIFNNVEKGLSILSEDVLFARYWTHEDDPIKEKAHKEIKCAEVLVPNRITEEYITKALVANRVAEKKFKELKIALPVEIKSAIFF